MCMSVRNCGDLCSQECVDHGSSRRGKVNGRGIGPKSVQTVTSLPLATNAINWDIGRRSALGSQEPQGPHSCLIGDFFVVALFSLLLLYQFVYHHLSSRIVTTFTSKKLIKIISCLKDIY